MIQAKNVHPKMNQAMASSCPKVRDDSEKMLDGFPQRGEEECDLVTLVEELNLHNHAKEMERLAFAGRRMRVQASMLFVSPYILLLFVLLRTFLFVDGAIIADIPIRPVPHAAQIPSPPHSHDASWWALVIMCCIMVMEWISRLKLVKLGLNLVKKKLKRQCENRPWYDTATEVAEFFMESGRSERARQSFAKGESEDISHEYTFPGAVRAHLMYEKKMIGGELVHAYPIVLKCILCLIFNFSTSSFSFNPKLFVFLVIFLPFSDAFHRFERYGDLVKVIFGKKTPATHICDLLCSMCRDSEAAAAAEKGRMLAEETNEDLSVAVASDTSSVTTVDIVKWWEPSDAMPFEILPEISPVKSLLKVFGAGPDTHNISMYMTLSRFLIAPRYSHSPATAIAHHALNFVELYRIFVRRIGFDEVSRLYRRMNKLVPGFGFCIGQSLDEKNPTPEQSSWLSDIGEGLDKLKRFETTYVGQAMAACITFMTTLPILFSEAYEADSYIKIYKFILKAVKISGTSLSSILKNSLFVYKQCITSGTTCRPKLLLSRLFDSGELHAEYIACSALLRDITAGMEVLRERDATAILNRFRRLSKRAKEVVLGPKPSPAQISLALECDEMVRDLSIKIASLGEKPFPFVVSLDGKPGCGKSTIMEVLKKNLHSWRGIMDIMNCSEIDLTQNFDNISTNATTCLIFDDQGNVVSDKRAVPLSTMLLKVAQGRPTPIAKADLKDKGKHFYNVEFIIICDNESHRGISDELYCEMAGRRRLGESCEVRVREEYANESGGFDETKLAELCPVGSSQEFRPYRLVKKGNSVIEQINIFPEVWIDNWTYFRYLKKRHDEHFQNQEARMVKAKALRSMDLCGRCQLAPVNLCPCGSEFFDSDNAAPRDEAEQFSMTADNVNDYWVSAEDEGDMKDWIEEVDGMKGESMAYDYASGLFTMTESLAKNQIDGLLLWGATNARVLALEYSFTSTCVDFLFRFHILTLISSLMVVFFGVAILVREDGRSLVGPSILFCLSVFFTVLARRCGVYWELLAHSDPVALLSVQTSNLANFSAKVFWGAAIIGVLASLPTAWKALVMSVPGYSGESETVNESPSVSPAPTKGWKEKELAAELEENPLPNDPPLQIWKSPVRKPFLASGPCNTISSVDMVSMAMANTFKCSFTLSNCDKVRRQYLLMINSCIGVTARHVLLFEGETRECVLTFTERNRPPIKISRAQMHEDRDLVFIYMMNPLGDVKPLERYFPDQLAEGKVSVIRPVFTETGCVDQETMEGVREPATTYEVDNGSGGLDLMHDCFILKSRRLHSGSGQCGLPYISKHPYNCIAGIHVAGKPSVRCIFMGITREDISTMRKSFTQKGLHIPPLRIKAEFKHFGESETELNPKHPIFYMPDDERVLEYRNGVSCNFTPHSAIEYNPHIDLAISCLGLKLLKAKPKMQWKRSCRAVMVSATERKPDGNVGILSASLGVLQEMAIEAVKTYKIERFEQEWVQRPLTVSEVLNGIPGELDSMDLNKSSGVGGKKGDFVEGEVGFRYLIPSMQEDVDATLAHIRNHECPGLYAKSCLKDELVKPGKETRLFYNSPMQLFIASSMYLSPLLKIINETPVICFTAIGMDPVGEEWFTFCEPFSRQEFEGLAVDLDYKGFDANQNPYLRSMVSRFFVYVARELSWKDEHVAELESLLAVLDFNLVNMNGVVMYLSNLLLSGYKYTAHKNGLITVLVLAYSWIKFHIERGESVLLRDFKKDIHAATLGDDNLMAISRSLRDKGWTPEYFARCCAEWGLEVTAADKTSNFKLKPFVECEFLKRYYSYHSGLRRNVFCASPSSFLQPYVGFIPGADWDEDLYYSDQCDRVVLEAFFGGKESFHEMQSRLRCYNSEIGKNWPPSLDWTWEELCEKYAGEEQPQLFPVVDRGMSLLRDYDAKTSSFVHVRKEGRIRLVEKPVGEADNGEGDADDTELVSTLKGELLEVGGTVNNDSPAEVYPIPSNTIASDMLSRRVILRVMDPLSSVGSFYPMQDMMGQAIFQNRLKNVAFMRADIEITIEIVSPSTFAGAIMFSVVYYPDSLNTYSGAAKHVLNLSQRPHIIVDLGQKQVISKLMVPFIYQHSAINPWDENAQKLTSIVHVPLAPVVSSATPNPAYQVKVYGTFKNLHAFGATATSAPAAAVGNSYRSSPKLLYARDDIEEVYQLCSSVLKKEFSDRVKTACKKRRALRRSVEKRGPYTCSRCGNADAGTHNCPFVALKYLHVRELRELGVKPITCSMIGPNTSGFCYLSGVPQDQWIKISSVLGPFPRSDEVIRVCRKFRIPIDFAYREDILHVIRAERKKGEKPRYLKDLPKNPNIFVGANRFTSNLKKVLDTGNGMVMKKRRLDEEKKCCVPNEVIRDTDSAYVRKWKKYVVLHCYLLGSPSEIDEVDRCSEYGIPPIGTCYLLAVADRRLWSTVYLELGVYPPGTVLTSSVCLNALAERDGLVDVCCEAYPSKGETLGYAHIVVPTNTSIDQRPLLQWASVYPHLLFGGEKLSNAMLGASKALGSVASISGLGSLKTPSEILRTSSELISLFGFSEVSEKVPLGSPTNYGANEMGKDYSNVLAINPMNEKGLGLPGFPEDQLTFESFNRQWNLISRKEINVSMDYGSVLAEFNVTPMVVVDTQPARFAIPALFTSWWRGSMEYKFQVVMPTMCTARISIFYDPLGSNHIDGLGSPAKEEIEDYLEHVILDTAQNRVATITVGYTQPAPALHTLPLVNKGSLSAQIGGGFQSGEVDITLLPLHWEVPAAYDANCHNGRIIIKVHDRIRGGTSSVPPNAQLLIFARSGVDMKYADFTGSLPPGLRDSTSVSPSTPERPFVIDMCPSNVPGTDPTCNFPSVAGTSAPVSTPAPSGSVSASNAPSANVPTAESPTVSTQVPTVTLAPTKKATASPSVTTAAPSKASAAPTKFPSSAPVSAAPSMGPSTASPITSLPTSSSPTSLPPTSLPPTAPPSKQPTVLPTTSAPTPSICPTGGTLVSPEMIAQTIGNGEFGQWNSTYGSMTFTGAGDGVYDLILPSLCERIAFTWTYMSGPTVPWEVRNSTGSTVLAVLNSASGTIVIDTPQNIPTTVGNVGRTSLQLISSSTSDSLRIDSGTIYGIPTDYVVSTFLPVWPTTHASVPNGFRIFDNANDRMSDMSYGTASILTYGTIKGYHFGVGSANQCMVSWGTHTTPWSTGSDIGWADSDSFATVLCYGDLTFLSFTGSVLLTGNVARWRREGFRVPRQGFIIRCNASGAAVASVSMYTKTSVSGVPRQSPPYSIYTRRRGLLGFGETQAVEAYVETEEVSHHLGGPIDNSSFFQRVVAGESMQSFRGLLKIPFPIANYSVDPSEEDGTIIDNLYSSGGELSKASLFGYLNSCFVGHKGSVISTYYVIGDGSLEVSRGRGHRQSRFVTQSGGIYYTDSRSNPVLQVRFPGQRGVLYTSGRALHGSPDDVESYKIVRINAFGARRVRVRESRSTGEDFDFIVFRAARELAGRPYDGTPNI